MATDDGFKFWASYYDALRSLGSDEQRGRFVMALCAYVFDGDEPEFGNDDVLRFGFDLIAEQAVRSKEISAARSEAGKLGGRPRKNTSKSKAKSSALSKAKSVSECVSTLVPNTPPTDDQPAPPPAP